MPFTEDLSSFFQTADHATAGTYTPNGGSVSTINGIFEKPYFGASGAEVDVESSKPTFLCQTSDVSSATHGDDLSISGTNYKVVGVEDDGTGVTLLILEEQ
jgi:hypothetical protein